MDPLIAISFKSFSSVWFWIMIGVSWSVMCHWTLGVPYDALMRADQKGGDYANEAERLAKLNIARIARTFQKGGTIVTALACFFLAIIATFGFFYDYELAQAIFVLLAPLTLVSAINVRLAMRLDRDAVTGEALRDALVSRRFWNQVIGLTSIIFSVLVAFVSFARDVVWWF